jgi:predicted permease
LETFCSNVEQREQFCHRLHDRLSQLPGVSAVTFATAVPLQVGTGPWSDLQVEGYAPGPAEEMRVTSATVAPDYFAALRIPLLEGRDFTEQDARGKALVAMVNQAFARRYFGGGRPLGRKIRVGAGWSTVVGVVKDIKWHNVTEQPLPQVYTAYRQTHGGEFWTAFFIRTAGPARNSMAAVRREATAIDTNAGQAQVVGFDEIVAGSIYAQKVAAALLSVLGAASLLLAALGLYSVLAYTVSQREHEFGIRMALGAAPAAVLGMVLRRGLVLTLAGIAVGSVMAAVAIRLAAPLLVGVQSEELTAIGGAAMFLGAIAILASYLPARRATQADPMVMLREP